MSSASAAPVRVRQASAWWSLTVSASVRTIALARESGSVLIRDDNHWLYFLNPNGVRQAQLRSPKELTTAACSDDGTALLVGGRDGDIWSLAPDLMPRWQRTLGKRVEALAVSPLGDYVAAADAGGSLALFTRKGNPVWNVQSPRPLRFLSFVPEEPFLVGSADYGLVASFDAKGEMVWRDGLVAHVGSLAVNGDGTAIVLACYTDGLNVYALKNSRPERQPMADACRLAVPSYDGRSILTAGLMSKIALLDRQGRVQGEQRLEAPATALALGALADRAIIGTAAGLVQCYRWR